MAYVTATDIVKRFNEKTGKTLLLPTDFMTDVDAALLEMKALGSQPPNAPYDNMAPEVTDNRLKGHFIATNVK